MPELELVGVVPLTVVGIPAAGTAGVIALPFICELVSSLPCCELLTVTEGGELPDAEGGEAFFFVALA